MPRCFSISIQSEVAWRDGLARLHRAGDLDRAGEQQQLLGQRRLAGVGVGNDGEGAAAPHLGAEFGHGAASIARNAGPQAARLGRPLATGRSLPEAPARCAQAGTFRAVHASVYQGAPDRCMADPTLLTIDDWIAASAREASPREPLLALQRRLETRARRASGSRSSTAPASRARSRRSRRAPRAAADAAARAPRDAALRRAVRGQGQHRRRRPADHRRLPGLRATRRRACRTRSQRLLDAGARLRRQDQPRPVRHRPGRHALALRRGAERASTRATISGGSSSGSAVRGRARRRADFALGTDTAGSGRVPAGFNNIVGLKPTRGRCQHARRRAGVPQRSTASRSSRSRSAMRRACSRSSMAPTRATPYSALRARAGAPLPRRAALRRARRSCEFFGDDAGCSRAFERRRRAAARARRHARSTDRLRAAARESPRCSTTARWWPSATPRSRASSTRTPTRSIRAGARHHRAAARALQRDRRCSAAQYALRALRSATARDVGAASTCCWCRPRPTHYTIAPMSTPTRSALNRSLGTYTNFVNLLDYARARGAGGHRAPTACPSASRLIAPRGSDAAARRASAQRFQRTRPACRSARRGAAARRAHERRSRRRWPRRADAAVAVVGAHLSRHAAQRRSSPSAARARCAATRTAPHYRLFALPGTSRPSPACCACADGGRARSRSRSGRCRSRTYGTLRRARSRAAGHRHARARRRQQRAGLPLRGACARRRATTSRASAAGAPTSQRRCRAGRRAALTRSIVFVDRSSP